MGKCLPQILEALSLPVRGHMGHGHWSLLYVQCLRKGRWAHVNVKLLHYYNDYPISGVMLHLFGHSDICRFVSLTVCPFRLSIHSFIHSKQPTFWMIESSSCWLCCFGDSLYKHWHFSLISPTSPCSKSLISCLDPWTFTVTVFSPRKCLFKQF